MSSLDDVAFKKFVGGSTLHEMQNGVGVLVLGQMGAGKSTSIAIQQGAALKLKAKGKYEIVWSDAWTPTTSDGFVSQTLNVGAFVDKQKKGVVYFDTAGLNESRGENERVWTTFSTSSVFALLKEISCTLVVIDYGASFGGRAQSFRLLAESLASIVGREEGSKYFYDSMAFLITNGFRFQRKITKEDLLEDVEQILGAEQNQKKTKLEALKRRYPDRIPDHCREKEELEAAMSSIRLLEAISNASADRIHISFPESRYACQTQRAKVYQMIASSPGISRAHLDEIVKTRQTHEFEVFNTFAKIATESLPTLRAFTSSLSTMFDERKKKAATLESIKADWENVRDVMRVQKQESLDETARELQSCKKERQELEGSHELCAFHVEQVRKSKSGFWTWFIRRQWASHEFFYDGDWYLNHVYEGERFEVNVKQNRPNQKGKGYLHIDLASESGYNLYVDVVLRREEKDLPATKERVTLLNERIEKLTEEKQKFENTMQALSAANRREDIERIVLDSIRAAESAHAESENDLKQGTPALWETIAGLAKLLLALEPRGMIPNGLASGPSETIKEFITIYKEADALQSRKAEDSVLMKYCNNVPGQMPFQATQGLREETAPKRTMLDPRDIMKECSQCLPEAKHIFGTAFEFVKANMAPLGLGLMSIMFWGYAFAVGICLVSISVRAWLKTTSSVIKRDHDDMKVRLDGIANHAMKMVRELISTTPGEIANNAMKMVERKLSKNGPQKQPEARGMLADLTEGLTSGLSKAFFG